MAEDQEEAVSSTEMNTEPKGPNIVSKIIALIFKFLRLLVILLSIAFIVFVIWKTGNFVFDKTQVLERPEDPNTSSIDIHEKQTKIPPFATIDAGVFSFEIRTSAPNSLNAYVKIHVILVYSDEVSSENNSHLLADELKARQIQIKDMLRTILVNKSYEELRKANSIKILKKELMNHVNHVLVNGKLADIYFTEWNIIPTGY